ncbi:APA family fibronectin-binding glycoprotein [Nocardia sp. NPDC127526]|uniref:APA family fibronectin-binding glycoprotein n=1 Tax=Nocardia sp. NPDC127526 TaxID=3345393 RepID=UPI0036331AB0
MSPRTARWVIALCMVALIGSLAGIGYLGFTELRQGHDDQRRVSSVAAGMSFVPPDGWEAVPQDGDDNLVFGQAALQPTGEDADGMILLGRLDESLFAAAESDNGRAACFLASGMGEFFFPDTGRRVNNETEDVKGRAVSGKSCFYRVEFESSASAQAEVYAAVVQDGDQRWWITWLGNSTAPVDRSAALRLAESIRPL